MMNKKIVISVNTAWNIHNLRSGLVRALNRQGYDVMVMAPEDGADEVSHVFTESAVAVAAPGDGAGATIVALSEMIGSAGRSPQGRAAVGMDGTGG